MLETLRGASEVMCVSVKIEVVKNFESLAEANEFIENYHNNVKESVVINNQEEQKVLELESFEVVEAVLHTDEDDITII